MSSLKCSGGFHSFSVSKVPHTRTVETEEIVNGVRVITRTTETYYTVLAFCTDCGVTK